VVGRGITVSGTPLTIVGVAPAGFTGVWLESPVDMWLPLMMQANVQYAQNYYNDGGRREEPFPPQNQIRWLEVIGRSRPATMTTQEALGAAFQRDVSRDADAIGDPTERRLFRQQRLVFEPFAQGVSSLRSRFGPPLFALLAMTGLILVVACANAANLLLARAEARRREIAVRLSIGASRGRVIRQLLTESIVLVMVATVCGIVFAAWTGDVLVRLALGTTGPLPFTTHIDGRVLGFTLMAAVVTVVLFGLAPAFRTTQVELGTALKTTLTRGGSRLSLQQALVVSQVAVSLGLLVAAGLLVGTLRNYLQVNLGFAPEHVLSVWVSPRASGYQPDRLAELYRRVVERVQAVPAVRSASVAACGLVVGCNTNAGVEIEGYQPQPGERVRVQENEIGLNYFPTVGMRLMEGRDFTERDDERSPKVAIVNQAMARRYFQGRSPLGRRFGDGRGRFEIVGVVGDARVNRVQEPATPMAFYPIEQLMMYPAASLEVRVSGDPQGMLTEVGRAVTAAGLPVDRVSTPSRQIELNLTQETLVARLASYFGALALALVCFGLFGTMSYVVSRRRTEFGIRLALGATRARLGLRVLRDSLGLVAIGLAAGIPAALGLSRVVAGLLFGIATTDLLTFGAAALLLALVATAAGLVPAWRAASVDPLVALRAE
jgi:predicted permease